MKIFEFNFGNGDIREWVLAMDREEAIEVYQETGDYDSEDPDRPDIIEVPKERWTEMHIIDIEAPMTEDDIHAGREDLFIHGYKIESTFKEFADRADGPGLIATTEW